MAAPVPLRSDFDADQLRALGKCSRQVARTKRPLALSAIYEGGSRMESVRIGAVGLQSVRDWVPGITVKGPNGLIDDNAPGAKPRLNPDQRDALRALDEQGPNHAAHGVVR